MIGFLNRDERVAINRATMTKFGFKVAELTVFLLKINLH